MQYMYLGRGQVNADKGVKVPKHKGIVCIGYEAPEEGTKNAKFSVAYCSPGDAFEKKKAHAIITGRFDRGLVQNVEVDTDTASPSYESVRTAVIGVIACAITDGVHDARHGGAPVAGVNMPRWMSSAHVE